MDTMKDPMQYTPPSRGADITSTDAVRVDAHKEDVKNKLQTYNQTEKKPDFGMLGMKGNGRQK